jgi:hypothetical protein
MPLECAVHSLNLSSILNQLQVKYVIRDFNLRIPHHAFGFLFQFYNFVSVTKTIADRLTPGQNGRMLAGDITTGLEPFTFKSTKRRKDDGGDGDSRGVKPNTHAKEARYLTNHIFLTLSPREVTTSRWRK